MCLCSLSVHEQVSVCSVSHIAFECRKSVVRASRGVWFPYTSVWAEAGVHCLSRGPLDILMLVLSAVSNQAGRSSIIR